jgi:hypothetical protein
MLESYEDLVKLGEINFGTILFGGEGDKRKAVRVSPQCTAGKKPTLKYEAPFIVRCLLCMKRTITK